MDKIVSTLRSNGVEGRSKNDAKDGKESKESKDSKDSQPGASQDEWIVATENVCPRCCNSF